MSRALPRLSCGLLDSLYKLLFGLLNPAFSLQKRGIVIVQPIGVGIASDGFAVLSLCLRYLALANRASTNCAWLYPAASRSM